MGKLENKCPFCRAPAAESGEDCVRKMMDRAEANDPAAMYQLGNELMMAEKGDEVRAFECFSKAASLGDVDAHWRLGLCYSQGRGVEKDKKKEVYHFEQASIGGHPAARHDLGVVEWYNGNKERAVKHWIIAAKQGDETSIDKLKQVYAGSKGLLSKEDFASALRGYQAAVDAT